MGSTVELLRAEPGGDPIALEEHYARAAWVSAELDDEVNTGIRDRGEDNAASGREQVLAALVQARREVEALLAQQSADRLVHIPWQGWSLGLDDFLTTRLMEMVVHSDDVAASLRVTAPELPAEALDPVLRLLTRLAVRRHGQSAVVSALSRSERAPATVSAF